MGKEFSGKFLKRLLMGYATYRCRIVLFGVTVICFFILHEKLLAEEDRDVFPSNFDYSEYVFPLKLYIKDIATLPGNVVFLGGNYHDGATTVHPALFVSRDEGRTWQEIPIFFPRSDINYFQTINTSHVWAIISWKVEGVSDFTYLLYSTNAGQLWKLSEIGEIGTYMQDRVNFQFFDEFSGLLSVGSSFNQETVTYYTKDGGQHWVQLWEVQRNPEIETSFVYPGDPHHVPPYAPLWTKSEHEYYKLTGVIQVRNDYETGRIVVETSGNFHEPAWVERSSLPGCYTILQNHLSPCYTAKHLGK